MKHCKKLLPAYCFILSIIMQPCVNGLFAQTVMHNDAWALLPFTKVNAYNPILLPGNHSFNDPITHTQTFWEAAHVFNPAIIVKNDSVFMLYRAQDSAGTSRIGMAVSTDGFHFTKMPKPVLFPDNDAFKK